MAAILKHLFNLYNIVFEELPDPRTKSWFLVAKPYQGLTILGLYLYFVLKWGPEFMKNRKPFKLKKLIIMYNIVQIAFCSYIFYGALVYAWGWKYKWFCEPVDYSNNPEALTVAKFVHYYYLSKLLDLVDTIFFVLRKKFNQVSFLHVYHHTGMVMLIWGGITYFPGGHATLIGAINSFVHIVLYGYYLYTAANPASRDNYWWKKYITQIQILQFFWCVFHMSALVFKKDCEYPRWVSAVFLPQNLFMLILFIDFYIKSYVLKPKATVKADVKHQNGKCNGAHKNENGNKIVNGKGENGFEVNGLSKNEIENRNNKMKSNLNGGTKSNGNSDVRKRIKLNS